MKADVVQQLLALNRAFYDELADPFARSRSAPMAGYKRLLAALPCSSCRVLDVGCGNGRFGRYLQRHGVLARYTGVDFSPRLLARARKNVSGDFVQRDLSQAGCLDGLEQYDVVACLSTMQHIPGHRNRVRLLAGMGERLGENGRVFLVNWQFMDSPRQRRKVQAWREIGLSDRDVEPNDYLLNWQRGGYGLRYVCLIDAVETAELAQAAGLAIVEQFRSDGKEGNLNLYTILKISNYTGSPGRP